MGDAWETWTYAAPHTGRYFLVVENEGDVQIQGYAVQIKDAPPTANPKETPLPDDDLAAMTLPYRSEQGPFAIRYPKEWKAEGRAPGVTATYASEEGGALEIVERDMVSLGMGKLAQGEYTNQVMDRLSATAPGLQAAFGRTLRDRSRPDRRNDHVQRPRRNAEMHRAALPASSAVCLRRDLLCGPRADRELEPLIQGSFRSFAVREGK